MLYDKKGGGDAVHDPIQAEEMFTYVIMLKIIRNYPNCVFQGKKTAVGLKL